MATTKEWIAGARPRTLPMAVAPVMIGAAAVFGQPVSFSWFAYAPLADTTFNPTDSGSVLILQLGIALLALVVSLSLQVGVNYANDYSDGIRGTDDARVGPMRLTGSGAAEPRRVKYAAFGSFTLAGLAGLGIVLLSQQWWMLAVGAICVLAAWWYTGGSRPYGYMGLGEVMVFVFFGLVAVLGTSWAMVAALTVRDVTIEFPLATTFVGAISHGLIASALLMANNVRDIPTDRESGKKTLAVRLGQDRARWSYAVMLGVAVTLPLSLMLQGPQSPWYLLVLCSWPLCLRPVATMVRRPQLARGPELIPVLQQTGTIGLAVAATFSTALLLS